VGKLKSNQNGFSVIEIIMVLVIIVLIGAVGWLVYKNHHKSTTIPAATTSTTKSTTSTSTKTTTTTPASPYAGWQTYDSKLGDFTIQYPAGWSITGFQGYNPVNQNQFNGNETELYISEYPESTMENNLGIVVKVSSAAQTATPYDTYPNGTTKVLSNGLTLWQEKQNVNYANGPATDTCPEINIGTDDTFSTQLSSGEYLSIYASYCWAQKMDTNYSCQQQLDSTAWNDAFNVIKSVNF
jgi:prepilin-type N-terminal cleavage/methylation domain-containing protein